MSPRAACRLDTLGFPEVYDYVPGKVDWLAHALPVEGTRADQPVAATALRHDVVTALLEERVGEVRRRVAGSPYGFALAVSGSGVLLGRLRRDVLDGAPERTVEDVMEPGPATVRPSEPLHQVTARMQRHQLTTALVTDPAGRLLGLVHRDDLAL